MRRMSAMLAALTFSLGAAAASGEDAKPSPANQVLPLLAQSKFKELDSRLTEMTAKGAACPAAGCPQDEAMDTLAFAVSQDETLRPMVEQWARASKLRFAPLLQGDLETKAAWQARGGGYSNTVARDAWPRFHAHLDAAEGHYRRAWQRDPGAAEAAARLVLLAIYQQQPPDELKRRIEAALAADPVSIRVHGAILLALSERWGGSNEAAIAYARELRKRYPENGPLATLLIRSHKDAWRRSGYGRDYFRDPAVWKEITDAFDTFLAAEPDSSWGNNQLAFLSWRAGDRERAKRAFGKIGSSWESAVWDDSRPQFTLAQVWALGDRPAASPPAAPAP